MNIQKHQGLLHRFKQLQDLVSNAAASGRQTADNIARNYRKKSGIMIMLAELALSIINGEKFIRQSSSDGEYSGDFHTEDVDESSGMPKEAGRQNGHTVILRLSAQCHPDSNASLKITENPLSWLRRMVQRIFKVSYVGSMNTTLP